ncbi:MAG TPA: sensor histidine kinase [Candidatus Limnocylindrales bacterium]|nr:sensor histidine kinase [Candidatus Limnocylindrales bacterium]
MRDRAGSGGPATEAGRPPGGLTLGEVGLVLLLLVLLAATLLTGVSPGLRFAVLAPRFDLLINGVSALIAGVAAWLSWLRYRHMADLASPYQAAAFMLFSITAAAQTLADLGIGDVLLGLNLEQSRQAPLYAWALLRVGAGGLLLVAAVLRLKPPSGQRWSTMVVPVALAGSLAIAAAVYALEPALPPLLRAEAFARLAAPDSFPGPLPGITMLELALQASGAALLAAAAFTYALAARVGNAPAGRYLAAGLLIAAFAQIHFALFPGVYSGLVTSSDVLRICFYAFVVFGIQAEAAASLRQIRAANRRLREMRDLELANASLTERARLARELHDGLAQHLWLARLTTERLTEKAGPDEIAAARGELEGLLQAGLEEARRSVSALRDSSRSDAPLEDILARTVRRFEESTGISARLLVAPDIPGLNISPVAAAELLRIAQEALNNVRKHADATVVGVELSRSGDRLRLAVRDNGVGFDASADHAGYGLESMRERAAAVGGQLSLHSAASAGTTVVVEVPLGAVQPMPQGPGNDGD